MGGNNEFFENFERNKYLKKLPTCKELMYLNYKLISISNSKFSYLKIKTRF